MHATDRVWSETNCYVDLWVEVLHALGHNPIPATAAVLSTDFDGHQWSFLKFAAEDLRLLYGIDVNELNIWQTVLEHAVQELLQGRLLTVEVNAFWLPDTAGTSYRTEHTKTTIVPNTIDAAALTMEYFHNSGYYRLGGDDFRGVFQLAGVAPEVLLPYVEVVRLDRLHAPDAAEELDLVRAHLARRPARNPVAALAEGVCAALPSISTGGLEPFHRWSFGVLRQCGASAELGADLSRYLDGRGVVGAGAAAESFQTVAQGAKSVQFRLARAARGRIVSVDDELTAMAAAWGSAVQTLADSG
ncbi:MAG: DUF1839 family protein [Actinomycetota bacterium]|nr:DUF1839 family protein [Actinomycetota bacterium]